MADNPFMKPSGGEGSTPRFAYGTPEYLNEANSRRTRRDQYGDIELEWFYDSRGDMRLRYIKTNVRVIA